MHVANYALHALGAGLIYLFNRTRLSAEELVRVHATPDAHVELLLDTLDVTSVQGPPPSVIVSTVGVCGDEGRARPGRTGPPVVPLQCGCWRRRGHGVQARGDAAAEIGEDGGGR